MEWTLEWYVSVCFFCIRSFYLNFLYVFFILEYYFVRTILYEAVLTQSLGRHSPIFVVVLANALSNPFSWAWIKRTDCVTYQMTQILTGYSYCVAYLNKIRREVTEKYHHCGCDRESTQHTLEDCPAWEFERQVPGRSDRTKPRIGFSNAGERWEIGRQSLLWVHRVGSALSWSSSPLPLYAETQLYPRSTKPVLSLIPFQKFFFLF